MLQDLTKEAVNGEQILVLLEYLLVLFFNRQIKRIQNLSS